MKLAIAIGILCASAGVAAADRYECKATETQPECFARLKCHDDEELEQCQKRLRSQSSGGDHDNSGRDDDRDRDRDRDHDRGDRDRGDRDDDRGDRGSRSRRGSSRRGGGRSHGRGRRGHRGGGGGGHSFEANKTFGLGIELGEPSGLNGKYFFTDRAAFDFGVGEIYHHYYYGSGLHLYGDVLFHPVSLVSTDALELPFYIGLGFRFWDFHYCVGNVCDYHSSSLGIRIPIGISFDFNNAPIDIFLQIVPVIDFVGNAYYDQYGDRTHAGVDGSVGFRFWFK